MFVNTHKFKSSEIILRKAKDYFPVFSIHFFSGSYFPAILLSQKITCLRDSTAVYRSFVNENPFFEATVDNFSSCCVSGAIIRDGDRNEMPF